MTSLTAPRGVLSVCPLAGDRFLRIFSVCESPADRDSFTSPSPAFMPLPCRSLLSRLGQGLSAVRSGRGGGAGGRSARPARRVHRGLLSSGRCFRAVLVCWEFFSFSPVVFFSFPISLWFCSLASFSLLTVSDETSFSCFPLILVTQLSVVH